MRYRYHPQQQQLLSIQTQHQYHQSAVQLGEKPHQYSRILLDKRDLLLEAHLEEEAVSYEEHGF
jgi:hypothetical protein